MTINLPNISAHLWIFGLHYLQTVLQKDIPLFTSTKIVLLIFPCWKTFVTNTDTLLVRFHELVVFLLFHVSQGTWAMIIFPTSTSVRKPMQNSIPIILWYFLIISYFFKHEKGAVSTEMFLNHCLVSESD